MVQPDFVTAIVSFPERSQLLRGSGSRCAGLTAAVPYLSGKVRELRRSSSSTRRSRPNGCAGCVRPSPGYSANRDGRSLPSATVSGPWAGPRKPGICQAVRQDYWLGGRVLEPFVELD